MDDRVPSGVLLGMGLQHAALAMVFAIYAAIFSQSIGLSPAQAAAYVSGTVLVMGLSTIIQAIPWRFGAGLTMVTIPGSGRMTIQIAIAMHYGLAAVMGATIVAGLLTILVARVIPRLRPIFPPEVIGVVLIMMGLSLVTGGVSRSVGISASIHDLSFTASAIALATIAVMVGLAIWGSAALRRVAMLAGILIGTALAAATGSLSAGAILEMDVFALPVLGFHLPWPEFHPAPILIMVVSQFMTMMDQMGSAMTLDRMTDAKWRRADMGLISRALTGLGLSTFLFGATGTLSGGSSSAHIGLVHASGVAAWRVGLVAGIALAVASFFPPLAGLLVVIPTPVVGGILIYAAAYMISSGIEMIMSRLMTGRRSFTVGLAIVMGAAVMLVPELGRSAPVWLQGIAQSGLTVGALTAILLNAIFRIGIKRERRYRLPEAHEGRQAAERIELCGREWALRADTVARAGHAVGEALEALREAGVTGPITLRTSFDEFNLVTTLAYTGKALRIGQEQVSVTDALLEDSDDDIDATMRRVSAALIRRLADEVRGAQRGPMAEVTLVFHH
ncbi:purine/pyrimidine permease [Acetobacteraceae bacterium H6797]|nr:purine/pyrimidine permease [Acetobacteraceae bacterium H6797]